MKPEYEKIFDDIISLGPREKIRRLQRVLAFRINSPVLDLCFPEMECNSSILLATLSCLVNGKMLLFGPSGTGKSTLVESTAQLIFGDLFETLQAATIHGHSQLTITDLERAVLPSGPEDQKSALPGLKKDLSQVSIVFIDDLSGMGEGVQTILNTLLEEGIIVRQNVSYRVKNKPVFATSNRLTTSDDRSRAMLDRFHVATVPTGLNPEWLGSLVVGKKFGTESGRGFQLDDDDLLKARREIEQIQIEPGILALLEFFLAELSHCECISSDFRFKSRACAYLEPEGLFEELCIDCPTRKINPDIICADTSNPVSTRALEGCVLYLKSVAWFLGRESVNDPDLVAQILPFIFLHRLTPSAIGRKRSRNTASRIPWLKELWNRSVKTYRKNEEQLEQYRYALASLMNPDMDPEIRQEVLVSAKESLEAVSSPAKYAFLNSLNSRVRNSG